MGTKIPPYFTEEQVSRNLRIKWALQVTRKTAAQTSRWQVRHLKWEKADIDLYTRLFVCLFVCFGFSSHWRIFHSYGDVTIAGEGLQILT